VVEGVLEVLVLVRREEGLLGTFDLVDEDLGIEVLKTPDGCGVLDVEGKEEEEEGEEEEEEGPRELGGVLRRPCQI
jgi:hypothetical protein